MDKGDCHVRLLIFACVFFFCKQKTAYELRISDWSSDVCSSDLKTNRSARHATKAQSSPAHNTANMLCRRHVCRSLTPETRSSIRQPWSARKRWMLKLHNRVARPTPAMESIPRRQTRSEERRVGKA